MNIAVLTQQHPAPWRVEMTSFGESMGYDSRSHIVDADGRSVITIGSGVAERRLFDEVLAAGIVQAVNFPVVPHQNPDRAGLGNWRV